ncbi:hypothetical protein HK405_012418 [Cladochytrium tenue]|nr:hypothetical protein HK405_012418 [Cladochytrium tenue]
MGFSNPEQLFSTCESLGFTLGTLTNVPTATSGVSQTLTSGAVTATSTSTDCAGAITQFAADVETCASSNSTQSAYYSCLCKIGTLISDIQTVFNTCPEAAFEMTTTAASVSGDNTDTLGYLYQTCQSMGYTLSSLTNVPTAISWGSTSGSATGSSSNSKATVSTSTIGGAPSTNRPGVMTAAAAGLAVFASVILF